MVLVAFSTRYACASCLRVMIGAGLLALQGGPALWAAQSAVALKSPVAKTVRKPGLPAQVTTPTLVAAGFGRLPASFTTAPLVAAGFGRVPATLTTPVLLAAGFGRLPSVLTTPALVARGFGPVPAQYTTKPLVVALPSARPR